MRRAASSIPSNIAEGCGREGDAELSRFCLMARGSAKVDSNAKRFQSRHLREPGAPFPPPPPPPPPGTPPPTTAAALPTAPPAVMMGFPFGFSASAVAFAVLPSYLSQILGRLVIDKTGIKGHYDFKLAFSGDGLPNNAPGPPPAAGAPAPLAASDPAPSIFTALQEEMGLRLDSAKGTTEVLVIDSVRKPTEN